MALQMGDFASGWLEYEWRWNLSTAQPRRFPQPRWCGEDPAGKTIFIHEEQGYGDAIQFFRYARLRSRAMHARPSWVNRLALARLLGELPGVSQVIVSGEVLPAFDLHCPVMSLPLLLDTRLETVPGKVPYFNLAAIVLPMTHDRLGCQARSGHPASRMTRIQNRTNRIRSIDIEPADSSYRS